METVNTHNLTFIYFIHRWKNVLQMKILPLVVKPFVKQTIGLELLSGVFRQDRRNSFSISPQ